MSKVYSPRRRTPVKDIIQGLIEQYYNTSEVVRDIVIRRTRGEQLINVFPTLAAVKWGLWKYGSTDIPDLEKQNVLLEEIRLRVAKQIYQLAKRSLVFKDKQPEWERLYGKHHLNTENHWELVDYSLGAFFWLEILTPWEYDTSEPQMDEH